MHFARSVHHTERVIAPVFHEIHELVQARGSPGHHVIAGAAHAVEQAVYCNRNRYLWRQSVRLADYGRAVWSGLNTHFLSDMSETEF